MTSRNLRAILGGGIGSGKSTAGRILRERGIHVIDADLVGHEVLAGPASAMVAERWPDAVRDGRIDRAALARIVFSAPARLHELEEMVHPLIRRRIREEAGAIDAPVVVEVPLPGDFLGPGWHRVVLDAPDRVRIERLLGRGMPAGEIVRRMAAQPTREEWLRDADEVIDNSGSIEELAGALAAWWRRATIPGDPRPGT